MEFFLAFTLEKSNRSVKFGVVGTSLLSTWSRAPKTTALAWMKFRVITEGVARDYVAYLKHLMRDSVY